MTKHDDPQFRVGDRVRCINAKGWNNFNHGEEFTVLQTLGDTHISIFHGSWIVASRFELVSRAGQGEATPDLMVECAFCNNRIAPFDLVCKDCYAKGCRSRVYPGQQAAAYP